MKQELRNVLNQLDDVDFREMQHAIQLAGLCRSCLREYNLSLELFAERLGYSVEQTKEIISGAFPFDLRSISKIDALRQALYAEANEKEIEPIIKFPDYKYSRPSEVSEVAETPSA